LSPGSATSGLVVGVDPSVEIIATLGEVGFRDATSQRREIGRETIAAIVARREHVI
jgi:hypothetical protein